MRVAWGRKQQWGQAEGLRVKQDPWLPHFLTSSLGSTGKMYSLPPLPYMGWDCSCAPSYGHNWLRNWSREGHWLTQLEELGGRKETKRLKVTSLETLQTSNLVKILYFLHEALLFACGLVEANIKNTHFHKIGSWRLYWLGMHITWKEKKKNDVIKTISKLLK